MIAIMGATGHTGSVVADKLLAAGQPIRVLGRSAERLQGLTRRGAQPGIGDVTEPVFLSNAFRDATAVYALVPPDYSNPDPWGYYDRVGRAIEAGIQKAGVRRLVLLSSLGAERESGTGLIVGLHRVEQRLKKLDTSLLSLRAGFFMENLYGSLGTIKQQGINGGSVPPEVPISMVAAEDIGAIAAEELQRSGSAGFTTREILGPRDYTMIEATRIIGQKIGKPDLKYVQFPDAGVTQAFIGMGFAPRTAELFVEMAHGIGTIVKSVEGRTRQNTTPTTLERFAEGLAETYRKM
jgi:uncharacterized protein YbjT (DUF2867 family)